MTVAPCTDCTCVQGLQRLLRVVVLCGGWGWDGAWLSDACFQHTDPLICALLGLVWTVARQQYSYELSSTAAELLVALTTSHCDTCNVTCMTASAPLNQAPCKPAHAALSLSMQPMHRCCQPLPASSALHTCLHATAHSFTCHIQQCHLAACQHPSDAMPACAPRMQLSTRIVQQGTGFSPADEPVQSYVPCSTSLASVLHTATPCAAQDRFLCNTRPLVYAA